MVQMYKTRGVLDSKVLVFVSRQASSLPCDIFKNSAFTHICPEDQTGDEVQEDSSREDKKGHFITSCIIQSVQDQIIFQFRFMSPSA